MSKKAQQLLNPDPVVINPEFHDEELAFKVEQQLAPVHAVPQNVGSSLIEAGDKIIPETPLDPVADAELLYEVNKQKTTTEPVTFVTAIRQLHVQAEVIRRNIKGEPVRVSKVIEFRNGSVTLNDPYEIKALRTHESYGGVGDEKPNNSGKEPIFWESSFPTWKAKQMQDHANKLSPHRHEQVQQNGSNVY